MPLMNALGTSLPAFHCTGLHSHILPILQLHQVSTYCDTSPSSCCALSSSSTMLWLAACLFFVCTRFLLYKCPVGPWSVSTVPGDTSCFRTVFQAWAHSAGLIVKSIAEDADRGRNSVEGGPELPGFSLVCHPPRAWQLHNTSRIVEPHCLLVITLNFSPLVHDRS